MIIEACKTVWNELAARFAFSTDVWEVIVFALSASVRRLAQEAVIKNGRAFLALVCSVNEVVVETFSAGGF